MAGGISSEDVDHALRNVVWPALRDRGFADHTARTAWRDKPAQVDVVNFQSFNTYNAGVLGITTFSFAVNLGTFARCRATEQIAQTDGELRPAEYECDFRLRLMRGFPQDHDNPDTWAVDESGNNLQALVEDARQQILSEGLDWFAGLDGLDAMLTHAREAPEDMSATWGMGNLGSPHRRGLVAALVKANDR